MAPLSNAPVICVCLVTRLPCPRVSGWLKRWGMSWCRCATPPAAWVYRGTPRVPPPAWTSCVTPCHTPAPLTVPVHARHRELSVPPRWSRDGRRRLLNGCATRSTRPQARCRGVPARRPQPTRTCLPRAAAVCASFPRGPCVHATASHPRPAQQRSTVVSDVWPCERLCDAVYPHFSAPFSASPAHYKNYRILPLTRRWARQCTRGAAGPGICA